MAETETAERPTTGTGEGNGEHGKGRTVARAAAIAAATGATAIAAKRALSDRGSSGENGADGAKPKQRKSGDSVMSSMLSSSWDSARDSIVPMLEDAAGTAGEYVARNAPDIVSETIVPEFIRGFERGRKSSSSSDDDE